jgi:pyridoxal/pyridoxine/pyridoxamine kinase
VSVIVPVMSHLSIQLVLARTAEMGAHEFHIVAAQQEIVEPSREFEAEEL